jgi:hypothetical protein
VCLFYRVGKDGLGVSQTVTHSASIVTINREDVWHLRHKIDSYLFGGKFGPAHSHLGVSLSVDSINSKQLSLLMRKKPNCQNGHYGNMQNNSILLANPTAVNISKLKKFVAENFPLEHPLQVVFIGENNVLPANPLREK